MGFEDGVEQSFGRPYRQSNARSKRNGPLDQFMPDGLVPFGQSLEGALPQHPFRSDIAILDFSDEGWLNPCGFVSFDFGIMTVLRFFRIWLETVRDQPVPTLPMVD